MMYGRKGFFSSSSFRFACFKITFFVSVINLTIILLLLHIQVVFIHIRFVKKHYYSGSVTLSPPCKPIITTEQHIKFNYGVLIVEPS
ncbi:hypothetical protein L1887_22827 [Cichorium endivia]|nr:hypothetical protein L1887_22827 [Cichorium endivia]